MFNISKYLFFFLFFRPNATKPKNTFDWTFSTDYKGTLSDNIIIEPTDETIDFDLLKRKEQIIFYHDLTLFEDELHDHGISKLSVKIVSNYIVVYNTTFPHNYLFIYFIYPFLV